MSFFLISFANMQSLFGDFILLPLQLLHSHGTKPASTDPFSKGSVGKACILESGFSLEILWIRHLCRKRNLVSRSLCWCSFAAFTLHQRQSCSSAASNTCSAELSPYVQGEGSGGATFLFCSQFSNVIQFFLFIFYVCLWNFCVSSSIWRFISVSTEMPAATQTFLMVFVPASISIEKLLPSRSPSLLLGSFLCFSPQR